MSKRKRVTADEKRLRMIQFFHENKEFYTLKDLETLIPKECGIINQSVKDVLQALVDEDLVHTDKIGTSIYFWSFPGEKIPALENAIGQTGRRILTLETKHARLKLDIQNEETNNEDFEKTTILLKEIEVLRSKEAELKLQIAKFSDADPAVIAELNEKAKFYKNGANIWTDNIYNLKTWCKQKFNIEETTLNKQFRIPEDLDYID